SDGPGIRQAARDWRKSQGGPIDHGAVDKPNITVPDEAVDKEGGVNLRTAGRAYAEHKAREGEEAARFDAALGIGNEVAVAEAKASAQERASMAEATQPPAPQPSPAEVAAQVAQFQQEAGYAAQIQQAMPQAVANHQQLVNQFAAAFPEIVNLPNM